MPFDCHLRPSFHHLPPLSPGHAHAEGVDEQLGEADDLQTRADERRRDDVVDEEGAVVGQEDAAPAVSLTLGLHRPLDERTRADVTRDTGAESDT